MIPGPQRLATRRHLTAVQCALMVWFNGLVVVSNGALAGAVSAHGHSGVMSLQFSLVFIPG